jgi:transcriptional regulator with XRE-family HTH domain
MYGARLRAAREARITKVVAGRDGDVAVCMTQSQLGHLLDTTQAQISDWERGSNLHPPTLEVRIALARALDEPSLMFTDEELADAG